MTLQVFQISISTQAWARQIHMADINNHLVTTHMVSHDMILIVNSKAINSANHIVIHLEATNRISMSIQSKAAQILLVAQVAATWRKILR